MTLIKFCPENWIQYMKNLLEKIFYENTQVHQEMTNYNKIKCFFIGFNPYHIPGHKYETNEKSIYYIE